MNEIDITLHEIKAPSLIDSKYGDNINEQFANIDDNFKTLSNAAFREGKVGDSVSIEYVSISKPLNPEKPFSEYNLGEKLYYALYEAVNHLNENNNITGSGSSGSSGSASSIDIISEYNNPLEPLKDTQGNDVFRWDDSIPYTMSDGSANSSLEYKVPIIKSINSLTTEETYICSAGVIMFFDARFSAAALSKYQNSYKENMIDTTCIVNFRYDNINSKWICDINNSFPTLKYKDGSFYWIVNNDSSKIKATGIKGERGSMGQIWIGTCEQYDEIEGKQVSLKQLLIDNELVEISDETIQNAIANGMQDNDSIVIYLFDEDKNYHGFFMSKIKIDQNQILIDYNKDLHTNHINYIYNTTEFFKSLGSSRATNQPAKGIFTLMYHDEDNKVGKDKYAHMIYAEGATFILRPVTDYETLNRYDDETDDVLNIKYNKVKIDEELETKKLNVTNGATISGPNGLTVSGRDGVTISGASGLKVTMGKMTGESGLEISNGATIIGKSEAPGGIEGGVGLVIRGGTGGTQGQGASGGTGLVVWGGYGQSGKTGLGLSVNNGAIITGGATISDGATIGNGLTVRGKSSTTTALSAGSAGLVVYGGTGRSLGGYGIEAHGGAYTLDGETAYKPSIKAYNGVDIEGGATITGALQVSGKITGSSGLEITNATNGGIYSGATNNSGHYLKLLTDHIAIGGTVGNLRTKGYLMVGSTSTTNPRAMHVVSTSDTSNAYSIQAYGVQNNGNTPAKYFEITSQTNKTDDQNTARMFLGGADTYNNNYIQICAGGSSSVFNNAPAGIEIHDKYESEKHSGLVTIKPGLKVSGGATISGRITGNSLTIAAGAAISGAATIGGIITGNGGAIITGSSGANLNETGGTSEGQVGLTIKGGTGGLNKQGYRHNGGTGLVVYGGGLYSGAGTGGATGKAIIAHGDVSISGDTEITGDVNISGYLNVKNGLAISTDTPNTASDCKDFQLNGSWTHSPQHQYLFIRGYGNRDDYVYLLFDKSIYPENSVVFLNGYKRNIRLVRNAKGDTQNIDNITILMLFGSTFTYNNNTYWAISSDNYYAIG